MNTTADELKYGVEYWEKLLTDMDDLKERLKEHKAALKAKGYNVKVLGQLVAIRRKDKSDEASQDINDLLLYAATTGTNLNVVTELEPTPIERHIEASKAKDGRFDPVRAMAEGIASGDERITKAASFPAGTTIEITPSSSRTDWPDDLPTRFVSDGGVLRPEAVQ